MFSDIGDWTDTELAPVLKRVLDLLQSGKRIEETSLQRWLRAHVNDHGSVLDCLNISPPREISITKVLSRAGSQKVVFLATWLLTQKEVVVKILKGPPDVQRSIIARELQPHPLSLSHPNIIETHLLKNDAGEPFLVESLLPRVLNDAWRAEGLQEAANLFRDIASALDFLRTSTRNLVHGDIKPDNIGLKAGRYILLDFGICRPANTFTEDSTATGSLRTRAPELLSGASTHSHSSDVWALAATVYNALSGRYPLFAKDEKPPRVSHPSERSVFELLLKQRIETEWDLRVDLSVIPDPLREPLGKALSKDPSKRPSAGDLVKMLESTLAAFLRPGSPGVEPFSPIDELSQLARYLPSDRSLRLMPQMQRQHLKERLSVLRRASGLTEDHQKSLELLAARIG